MSRVGRLPIALPKGVEVQVDGDRVRVRGPRGTGEHVLPAGISVSVGADHIEVQRGDERRQARAMHGLTRKLLANLVEGVSTGFRKRLEIVGVGYRAEAKGQELHLSLGFSHPVVFRLPEGVQARVERQTVIDLESNDKQLLGQVAADIRRLRPPEPYKGKGIRYAGEQLRTKAGKAAGR